jgi:hypothetical protein
MKSPRPYRGAARVAQIAVGPREGAPYAAPATLPPRPPWLKLGARVAILRPVSDKCAMGVVGYVYEIRPTEDGATWEVRCGLGFDGLPGHFRLQDPQEFVLWKEAGDAPMED